MERQRSAGYSRGQEEIFFNRLASKRFVLFHISDTQNDTTIYETSWPVPNDCFIELPKHFRAYYVRAL